MKRRTLLRTAAGLAGVTAAGGATTIARRGRNRYYDGPESDHFDGVRFFNPDGSSPKGLTDALRWRFGPKPAEWPESIPMIRPAVPAERVQDLTITMVGHATLLIQMQGLNILTDPVWSDRVSPVSFAGPKRVIAPGIAFSDLPPIDLIVLSHCHYDHLDLATLHRLKEAHDPHVITPLGNDTIIAGTGLRTEVMDWGDETTFGPLGVHCLPCHHWSARGVTDRSMALWAAFMLTAPGGAVHFIGDTGFDQGRPYQGLERFGPIRAAILPIGAYDPRWFMADQHQDPDEAVQGFLASGAVHAVGHHWGTIQLTNEARDEPRDRLAEMLDRHAVDPARFRAMEPAEVWEIPAL